MENKLVVFMVKEGWGKREVDVAIKAKHEGYVW